MNVSDFNDFKRTLYDYYRIEARRHGDTMAAITDVNVGIAALHTAIDAKTAAFSDAVTSLKGSVETAIGDLTTAGAAGQSALLDTIVAALRDVLAKINAFDSADQLNVLKAEVAKAIATVPVPTPTTP